MQIVTPYLTFPPVDWWLLANNATTVLFEAHEHFTKMSYRNRYRIGGANNSVLLTVPLTNGRDQRTPIQEVLIANDAKWQTQHWRTLVSVYNRSPYFFHYEHSLRQLYEGQFTHLLDFNMAALEWVLTQAKINMNRVETAAFNKHYPSDYNDIRQHKGALGDTPRYYQVFEDRTGFIEGLSILDLIFSEGPHTGAWLGKHSGGH